MPGFDRTGPEGRGSRTGRGLGKCNPRNKNVNENEELNDLSHRPARGYGRRRGRGLGLRMGKGRQETGEDE